MLNNSIKCNFGATLFCVFPVETQHFASHVFATDFVIPVQAGIQIRSVILAQAGIWLFLVSLDPRLRGDDNCKRQNIINVT